MSLPILRNYQADGQLKVAQAFSQGLKRILLVVPTGGGKTNIASDTIRKAKIKSKHILFIAHRKELIDQAHARLEVYGVLAGKIQGKNKFIGNSVNVASVQTLVGLEEFPKADLVFIDEAHHFVLQGMKVKQPDATEATPGEELPAFKPSMYAKVFEHYKDKAHFIGLTATPTRLDGQGLADVFEQLVVPEVDGEEVNIAWLQKEGFLVPVSYYGAPFQLETDNIKKDAKTGDFNQKQVFEQLNKKEVYEGIVDNWLKHAKGLKTIAFCTNKEACVKLVEEFKAHGITADYLVATMSKEERENKLNLFAKGFLTVLVNIDILTEGYDLPAIECVVANRATDSVSLWLQIIGRGLRPIYKPGYDLETTAGRLAAITASHKQRLIVLDNGTNCKRLGFAEDAREYSLEGRKKGEAGTGIAPITECSELKGGCGLFYAASLRICPGCGKEAPAQPKEAPKKVEMVELKPELPGHLVGKRPGQMTLPELEEFRSFNKHNLKWIIIQLKVRAEILAKKKEKPEQTAAIFEALLFEYAKLITPTKQKTYKAGWVNRALIDHMPEAVLVNQ